jgi:hypothetical protein
MRLRLCLQPLAYSSRIAASMSGKPVRPRCRAASRRSQRRGVAHGKSANAAHHAAGVSLRRCAAAAKPRQILPWRDLAKMQVRRQA